MERSKNINSKLLLNILKKKTGKTNLQSSENSWPRTSNKNSSMSAPPHLLPFRASAFPFSGSKNDYRKYVDGFVLQLKVRVGCEWVILHNLKATITTNANKHLVFEYPKNILRQYRPLPFMESETSATDRPTNQLSLPLGKEGKKAQTNVIFITITILSFVQWLGEVW